MACSYEEVKLATDTKPFLKNSVILVHDVASSDECTALVNAFDEYIAGNGPWLAQEQECVCPSGDAEPALKRVRICDLGASVQELASKLLQERVLNSVEQHLPTVAEQLFGQSADLKQMSLSFSSGEPAINRYTQGGEFKRHRDHFSMTVYVTLSAEDAYLGGGTGFWPQDDESEEKSEPVAVVRARQGTAVLFNGDVEHAGMPVESGVRHLFVASFHLSPGDANGGGAQIAGSSPLSVEAQDEDEVETKTSSNGTVAAKASAGKDFSFGLVESSLWKENVHVGGHHSVWGSWYDSQTKRWGYACCHSSEAGALCTDPKQALPSKKRRIKSFDYEQAFDWSNPPTSLMPYEKVMLTAGLLTADKEHNRREGAFLNHFVRFAIGTWRRLLEGGKGKILEEDLAREIPEEFMKNKFFEETQEGLVPLLRQIQKNEMDRKLLRQLDKVVSLAAQREYSDAATAYVDMTCGRKKWNNTLASYGGTHCQNKGFRIYITKQDDPNAYDQDPIFEKIMHSLRKLVRFVEVIYPNSDTSKKFTTS